MAGGYDYFVGRKEKRERKTRAMGETECQLLRGNDLQDSWSLLNFFFFLGVKSRRKRTKEVKGGGWLKRRRPEAARARGDQAKEEEKVGGSGGIHAALRSRAANETSLAGPQRARSQFIKDAGEQVAHRRSSWSHYRAAAYGPHLLSVQYAKALGWRAQKLHIQRLELNPASSSIRNLGNNTLREKKASPHCAHLFHCAVQIAHEKS